MSRIRWVAALAIVLSVPSCASSPGSSRPLPPAYAAEPAPVRMAAGADVRSADVVYRHGVTIIERNPAEAASAFLWAATLDPTWAAPVFARRLALLMTDTRFFDEYLAESVTVRKDPRTSHLDSLYLRALQLNPFLDRALEAQAFRYMIAENYRRRVQASQPGAFVDDIALSLAIDEYLRRARPQTRAWVAHADGRYADAAELYRSAMRGRKEKNTVGLRVDLARVLFRIGDHANAISEMERALATLRADDTDRIVRVYRSKALLEFTLGMINEEIQDPERARGHYANALQEDLSWFQPHMRMAALALADGDTATSRASYRLAVDIAPTNPLVLLSAGRGLDAMGDEDEGEALLRRVLDVAPEFATPHHDLARLLERRGDAAAAMECYRKFLEMGSRTHPERRQAEARLNALRRSVPPGGEG